MPRISAAFSPLGVQYRVGSRRSSFAIVALRRLVGGAVQPTAQGRGHGDGDEDEERDEHAGTLARSRIVGRRSHVADTADSWRISLVPEMRWPW